MADYLYTLVDNDNSTDQISYPLNRGQSLLKNLLHNDILTHSKCGGKAVCGLCRVKVTSIQKFCNKPVSEEIIHLGELQIKQGWRLACQLYSLKDISLYIPSLDEINQLKSP